MVQRLHKLGIKVGIITNGHFSVRPSPRSNIFFSYFCLLVQLGIYLEKLRWFLFTVQVQRKKLKACKADLLFDTILVGGGNLVPLLMYSCTSLSSQAHDRFSFCKNGFLVDIAEEPNQKPHKSIFLKACRLAGCNPEETIMVGDNLKTDIQVTNFSA